MLKTILINCNDFAQVLKLDVFLKFIDIFQENNAKKKSAILILNTLVLKHKVGAFEDFNLAFLVIFFLLLFFILF